MNRARDWEVFCDNLFRVYQEQALEEVGAVPIFREHKLTTTIERLESPSPQPAQKREVGGRA